MRVEYRILYFRGGLLGGADEVAADDLVAVTKAASSTHPYLTAEMSRGGCKVAVVRPCSSHQLKYSGASIGPWPVGNRER